MEKEAELIKKGGIGILPTDTLYGIVASALNLKAVETVYTVKKRNKNKPCIVLVRDINSIERFGIFLTKGIRELLSKIWPGKVTVIFTCEKEQFSYLHRGTKTIAFRLPKDKKLISFLEKTGPIIAPSANPEGENPASTIEEARAYFGNSVGFYIDGGTKKSLPSTIIKIDKSGYHIVRQGDWKIDSE